MSDFAHKIIRNEYDNMMRFRIAQDKSQYIYGAGYIWNKKIKY